MRKMSVSLKASIAGAVLLLAGVSSGYADNYDITYNGCSSGCGNLGVYGTVKVGGEGTNVLTFDVDLASNIYFHNNGNGTTFQFSLDGVAIDLDPAGGTNATLNLLTAGQGWTFAPPPPINPLDALGTFLYGFNCTAAPTCGNDLQFTLTFTTPGDIRSLIPETGGKHGELFAGLNLALCTGNPLACGDNTGPFGATHSVPGPIVGAGLPGLVLACGGLLGLARRRRQQMA